MSLAAKIRAVAALLVFCMAAAGQAQRTITIRLLNANDGRPIKNERLTVWAGPGPVEGRPHRSAELPTIPAGKDGIATVAISNGDTTLSIIPDFYIACEPTPRMSIWLSYSIPEILKKGQVSENVCGKAKAQPKPGELILFMKPRPWWHIG